MKLQNYIDKLENNKPAKNVYVAFLDILGFSGFVSNNAHEDVLNRYRIIRYLSDITLTEVAELGIKDSQWLKELHKSRDYFDIEPSFDNVMLSSIVIPDFITLASKS